MTFLAIGIVVLLALAVLVRLFSSADPILLTKVLRWSLIILGVFFALFLLLRGQALLAAAPAAVAAIAWRLLRIVPMGLWFRLFQMGRARRRQHKYSARGHASSQGPEQQSVVNTEWLHMTLDHSTGDLSGEVVKGSFSGQRLNDMEEKLFHKLFDECSGDESSMQLLQSYLDRRFGASWHENFRRSNSPWGSENHDMGPEEAYEVLGLAANASEADIKEAHRKLMASNHPDHGGSSYLATKINRARDVLLKK